MSPHHVPASGTAVRTEPGTGVTQEPRRAVLRHALVLLVGAALSGSVLTATSTPAEAAASNVFVYSDRKSHVQPADWSNSPGGGGLRDTRWTSWTRSSASGSTRVVYNTCKPSCAAGNHSSYRATVTLDQGVRRGSKVFFQRGRITPAKGSGQSAFSMVFFEPAYSTAQPRCDRVMSIVRAWSAAHKDGFRSMLRSTGNKGADITGGHTPGHRLTMYVYRSDLKVARYRYDSSYSRGVALTGTSSSAPDDPLGVFLEPASGGTFACSEYDPQSGD